MRNRIGVILRGSGVFVPTTSLECFISGSIFKTYYNLKLDLKRKYENIPGNKSCRLNQITREKFEIKAVNTEKDVG